ncbi:MAG: glutathione S-transferase [Rhodothermales bacterium]|jgi:glutathione S-transferase
MLKLYGLPLSTPVNRVRFTAHLLDLPYEFAVVNLPGGEHLEPAYLGINEMGKIPAIDDDGFLLSESNAICRYLCRKHSSELLPQDLQQQAIVDRWLDFVGIHVHDAFVRIMFNKLLAPLINVPVDETAIRVGYSMLKRFLPVVDAQLAANPFVAGNACSLADIVLLSTVDPAEILDVDLSPFAHVLKWRAALQREHFYTSCHSEFGQALAAFQGQA